LLEKPAVFAKNAGFCIHKIEREKKSMSENVAKCLKMLGKKIKKEHFTDG
jgi:hypothetical protein